MRRRLLSCALSCAASIVAVLGATAAPAGAEPDDTASVNPFGKRLYLVTMTAPGTAGHAGPGSDADYRMQLRSAQDDTLDRLGDAEPIYRWTTALSGFAVRLDSTEAAVVAAAPGVRMVEAEDTLRLTGAAGRGAPSLASGAARVPSSGPTGRGTVIGFVDTGIHPETPAFASSRTLGKLPRSFRGACPPAEDWSRGDCNDKVVAARHFIAGFGADQLRAEARISPRDDDGHGTQVASIAAGNAEVTALTDGTGRGVFTGTAPDARIAAYKACWAAPDPADDGCSTADVVAAIDAAVRDGVDVLNLSMSGRPGLDTVDLALLGAAEDDIAVTMAAGNGTSTTASAQPWTTAVGASNGPDRHGELRLSDGSTFEGVMAADGLENAAPLVRAATIPAPGHSHDEARLCVPGSLDAAGAAGSIVLCERGRVARVDKSAAVELADGVGMVLVNAARKALSADFHAVPTLHVSATEGERLRRALRAEGRHTGRLVSVADPSHTSRVLPWSARGRVDADVLAPALVSPGFGLLAATAPGADGSSWELLTGTSASTATVSGLMARLRSLRPDWPATRVRSALMTSAESAGTASPLAQGSGVPSADLSRRPGLVFDLPAGHYRSTLAENGRDTSLNLPSAMLRQQDGSQVVRRTVTNVGNRHKYFSSTARGFTGHDVTVTPAAIRIAPGESREFRVRIAHRAGDIPDVDSGWVTWHGANGTRVRMPVVLSR